MAAQLVASRAVLSSTESVSCYQFDRDCFLSTISSVFFGSVTNSSRTMVRNATSGHEIRYLICAPCTYDDGVQITKLTI
jgi:hypothetical protein